MGNQNAMRVAVIGAGAGGLAALRHLAASPHKFSAVAYEMTSHVSGTWVYTDKIGKDEHGLPVHSSMYRNLRTNLPKEVMAFPDFPFSKDLPSFLTHIEVRKYLEDYAEHFKLYPHIKFNKKVELVVPKKKDGDQVWDVSVSDVLQPQLQPTTQQFDAVIICNGHYALPLIPDLTGLSNFEGVIMHSHNYRIPEVFSGKTVALLGAAASGQDIALDLAKTAKQVYLCHRKKPLSCDLPDNVTQKPGIQSVNNNSIILEDGTELNIEGLLFCTGYHYNFEFLDPQCRFKVEDERVTPLYKHLIHAHYPSLSTIGLPKTVCPFPQFDCQVRFVLAALSGDMILPSSEEMEADSEKEFNWRLSIGMPPRHAHTMGKLQWEYNDKLAELAGFEPIPRVVQRLYDYVHDIRATNLVNYKTYSYDLMDDQTFITK